MTSLESIKKQAVVDINYSSTPSLVRASQTILRLCEALEKCIEQRDDEMFKALRDNFMADYNDELQEILERNKL